MPQKSEPNRRQTIAMIAVGISGFILPTLAAGTAQAAADLAKRFGKAAKGSSVTVDHSAWTKLLQSYVKPEADGLNRVDYAAFKAAGRPALTAYLQVLEASDVAALDRNEQFAFWANLYNAKTIDVVLEHYPVATIRDIDISPGLFSNGPWGKKVTKVAGVELSLDDIEHQILRPVMKDARVHYAVNCASVGCPNLGIEAFSGATLEAQLDAAARAFVNSPRGALIRNGKLKASSIYDWFQVDFGGSEQGVLAHFKNFADAELASQLAKITGVAEFGYDWGLNDVAG